MLPWVAQNMQITTAFGAAWANASSELMWLWDALEAAEKDEQNLACVVGQGSAYSTRIKTTQSKSFRINPLLFIQKVASSV